MILIEYSHSKDIAPYYLTGTTGKIYLDTVVNDTQYNYEEAGVEDGELAFFPAWQRGLKRYTITTKLQAQHSVELMYRLAEMDTVQVIQENGKYYNAKRLEVSHSYPFEDKKWAQVKIEFDIGEILTKRQCEDALNY
jgi:ribonucleotide reductase alpha subunit